MTETPIQRAITICGGRKALAQQLSAIHGKPIQVALVWQWENGERPVAPKHAIPVESITRGKVTRYELAPEVFGSPRKQRRAG